MYASRSKSAASTAHAIARSYRSTSRGAGCRPWAVAVRLLRSGNGSWKMHKPAYSLIANRSPLSRANWKIFADFETYRIWTRTGH